MNTTGPHCIEERAKAVEALTPWLIEWRDTIWHSHVVGAIGDPAYGTIEDEEPAEELAAVVGDSSWNAAHPDRREVIEQFMQFANSERV